MTKIKEGAYISREDILKLQKYKLAEGYDEVYVCRDDVLELIDFDEDTSGDMISREAAIALADTLKDDVPDDERIADAVMAHNEGILEYQTKLSLLPSAQLSTLDKIKAELKAKSDEIGDKKEYEEGIHFGLMLACQIVNKAGSE